MIMGLRIPDCDAGRAWLDDRRRRRPQSFGMTKALIVWPVRSVARRVRARLLEASYRRGRPVTVRMARRVRPQDTWTSGRFAAAAGSARWRTLCGGEWFALSAPVADRLVGDARRGATVFSLRDGAQVSVSAVYADVVRAALGAAPGAGPDEC
jgi:hypothetical protein